MRAELVEDVLDGVAELLSDLVPREGKGVLGGVGVEVGQSHAEVFWEEVGAGGGPLSPLDEGRSSAGHGVGEQSEPYSSAEDLGEIREKSGENHREEEEQEVERPP